VAGEYLSVLGKNLTALGTFEQNKRPAEIFVFLIKFSVFLAREQNI
jgi:hypothetical protein